MYNPLKQLLPSSKIRTIGLRFYFRFSIFHLGSFNRFSTKLSYFHPLEVVSRYRDPQIQVGAGLVKFLEWLVARWATNIKVW